MLTAIDQFLLVLDNGRCQHGLSPPGWCDIFDKDLFDLAELARSASNMTKRHNTSICMDSAVAKSLLNATCLEAPITLQPPILMPVLAAFGCVLVLLIITVSVCCIRRRQRRRNHGRVPAFIELDQCLYSTAAAPRF